MKTKSRSLLRKRICSLVLVMTMVFTSISTTAFAEDTTFTLSDESRIVVVMNDLSNGNVDLEDDMKLMSSEFAAKGLTGSGMDIVYGTESTAKAGDILVCLTEGTADSNPEGYELEISDIAKVTATGEDGIFYGMRRIQKAMIANDGALAYETISEEPAIATRAFHLDNARKFFSKEWVLAMIKDLSYQNINQIQYHFSENEGFRLQSDTLEERVEGFTYPSDGHMTKTDMLEIIETCNKYHIELVPSMDSPGHMRYVLQFLPDNWNIDYLFSGDWRAEQTFNIFENAEAKQLIIDMFHEFAEFFSDAGCTHMNIGGDEFLNNFGSMTNEQHQVVANYFNEVARIVKGYGLTPRAWNDGLRYQGFTDYTLDSDIEICYWSAPNNCASVQDFVDNGHSVINYSDVYMYFAVNQWWMNNANASGEKIFTEWHPGKLPGLSSGAQEYEYPYDEGFLLGASYALWCDNPDYMTVDTITTHLFMRTRAMAIKSWDPNTELTYSEFETLANKIGRAPGYDSELPASGTIYYAEEIGTVTLQYVDEAGNEIKADKNIYGIIGEEYTVSEEAIYGYRFVSMDGAGIGTFTEENIVVTLTYELYTDKGALQTLVDAEKLEEDYIPKTFAAYKTALADAKEVLADDTATQLRVDEVAAALESAEEELVAMSRLELYLEVTNPKSSAGYTAASYAEYEDAVEAGETVLYNAEASDTEVATALQAIQAAKATLVSAGTGITVTANKAAYSTYALSNILDGDTSTYAWLNGAQTVGDYLLFTFESPVILNTFNLVYPGSVGGDYFQNADVQISTDGTNWTKIGEAGSSSGITIDAGGVVTQYVRIYVTQTISNWTQIAEATFDYDEVVQADTTELQSEVDEVLVMDLTLYTTESIAELVDALDGAYAVLNGNTAGEAEVSAALTALQDARAYLIEKEIDPDAPVDKTALVSAIASAEALTESDYTAETWAALESALASAIEVNADAEATQAEVSEAISALRTAQRALKIMVHKTALEAAITAAQALEEDDYTSASWSTLQNALEEAIAVNENDDATQNEVDTAAANLTAAQAALIERADDPTDDSMDLDSSKITYSAGSEVESSNATSTEGGISLAFDGNTNTYWHSAWSPSWYGTDDCADHLWVQFDISEPTVVDAIRYLPRSGDSRNGDITGYRVEGTVDGTNWITLTEGTWESTSQEWKMAKFDAIEVTGLRLVATSTHADTDLDKFASASELRVRTAEEDKPVEPENPFEDVYETDYYYNPVLWAYNAGITAGTSETTFEPNAECTRAQVVTFMWRAAGRPEPTTAECTFTDVLEGAYYYKAVLWAVERGITSGTSETTFEPEAKCTRAQVVSFLWRAAGKEEPTTTVSTLWDVTGSEYYGKAVLWAMENGIAAGATANTFEPHAQCTRGQIVTFLYRYYN